MASVWNILIVLVWTYLLLLTHGFPSVSDLAPVAQIKEHIDLLPSNYHCPSACSCNGIQSNVTINCEFKRLSRLPQDLPSSVCYLNLAGNEVSRLFHDTSLQTLHVLNVSQNPILDIDSHWLSSLSSLKVLNLSNCSLHSSIIENKLQVSSLEHLELSNNKLDQITETMFDSTKNLLSLNLSCNEIKIIRNDSFKNILQLNVLDLSSNKLSDLQHGWFKNLQDLHTLVLKNNKLNVLKNVIFSTLKNLKFLDLSSNYIKSIGLLSLKGLINLEFLNLSNNDIVVFQSGILRSVQSLMSVDLSNNSFSKIDSAFIHTKVLKFLYLKNLNNLKNLTSFSFSGLSNLEFLDLSNSNIVDINLKTFFEVPNLRHLDLSNAKLSSLKMGAFSKLQKIEILKLNGNPWKCDCYLYWLLTWLGERTNTHLMFPSQTFCYSPPSLKGHVLLDALDLNMVCTNASIHQYTNKTKFKVGFPALLECQVEGNPLPSLTWLTPQNKALHWNGFKNNSLATSNLTFVSSSDSNISTPLDIQENRERFYLMQNGNLAIKNIERGDGGFYVCIASNPLNYVSVSIRLTLDYEYITHIKIVSILVGIATSFGFLLLTLISILIKMILKHFGIKCPCRSGSVSPRTQQIKKILESMEHYKKQQLDRLRDNYNGQVQKIKDNCMQQMERLRESYSSQSERLRDIKEYGTLQIDRIRDNYYSQVQRVRDYSASQIIRLRENYIFQRNRIRKFSAHHLYKLRENYKVQQQHFNKILENLNIESCRNVCQRTESVIFEPEMLENVLMPKICLQTFAKEICDSNDNSSQISAYFTPDEAGSEISGHESDDPDCLNNFNCLENPLKVDLKCVSDDETTSDSKNPENYRANTDCPELKEEQCLQNPSETIV